ncbi:MAG: hypothetical protein WCV90_00085 [Candidatus Woesearchaeota archaeon]|jgi:hypothetical protein
MASTDNLSGLRELMRRNDLEFITADQFAVVKPAEQTPYYARFSKILRTDLQKEPPTCGLGPYRETMLLMLDVKLTLPSLADKYGSVLRVYNSLVGLVRISGEVERMGSDPAYREYGVAD